MLEAGPLPRRDGGLLDLFVRSEHDSVTAAEPPEKLHQFVKAHVAWKLEQSEAASAYTTSIGCAT